MGFEKKRVIDDRLKGIGASRLYQKGHHLSCTYLGQELPEPIFLTHGHRTKRGELTDLALNRLAHGLYAIDERVHGENARPIKWYKKVLKGKIKARRVGGIEEIVTLIIGLILVSVFSFKFSITGNFVLESGTVNPFILISILSLIAVIVVLLIKLYKK